MAEAQVLMEQWRVHYNTIRPHKALGYRPPAPEIIVPAEELPMAAKLRKPTFNLDQFMRAGQRRMVTFLCTPREIPNGVAPDLGVGNRHVMLLIGDNEAAG